jgi:hypothetical protein
VAEPARATRTRSASCRNSACRSWLTARRTSRGSASDRRRTSFARILAVQGVACSVFVVVRRRSRRPVGANLGETSPRCCTEPSTTAAQRRTPIRTSLPVHSFPTHRVPSSAFVGHLGTGEPCASRYCTPPMRCGACFANPSTLPSPLPDTTIVTTRRRGQTPPRGPAEPEIADAIGPSRQERPCDDTARNRAPAVRAGSWMAPPPDVSPVVPAPQSKGGAVCRPSPRLAS